MTITKSAVIASSSTEQSFDEVVYGPGSILVAHAVDEYVEIEQLMITTKSYALAAMDWCGLS